MHTHTYTHTHTHTHTYHHHIIITTTTPLQPPTPPLLQPPPSLSSTQQQHHHLQHNNNTTTTSNTTTQPPPPQPPPPCDYVLLFIMDTSTSTIDFHGNHLDSKYYSNVIKAGINDIEPKCHYCQYRTGAILKVSYVKPYEHFRCPEYG